MQQLAVFHTGTYRRRKNTENVETLRDWHFLVLTRRASHLVSPQQERDARQRLGGERPEGNLPVVPSQRAPKLEGQQQRLDLQLILANPSTSLLSWLQQLVATREKRCDCFICPLRKNHFWCCFFLTVKMRLVS